MIGLFIYGQDDFSVIFSIVKNFVGKEARLPRVFSTFNRQNMMGVEAT
jgi:hypothetical protein